MQPFWWSRDLVFRLLGADPAIPKVILWWLLGCAPYIVADRALTFWSRRRSSGHEAA
jgi:hypothetical protein